MSTVAENVAGIRERIAKAARRAGRRPEDVRLVAVSKKVEAERVRQAIAAGVAILGENYIQEAQGKVEEVGRAVSWHFIGHLQTNKAKHAVRLFAMVHAVDSLALAQELSRQAGREGKVLSILLQADLAGEATKFGARAEELEQMAEAISRLPSLAVKGLMTMPPYAEDPEDSRRYFAELRQLRDRLTARRIQGIVMDELSMGMSNDFEVAIEEGATLVRVGTAIFGMRPEKRK